MDQLFREDRYVRRAVLEDLRELHPFSPVCTLRTEPDLYGTNGLVLDGALVILPADPKLRLTKESSAPAFSPSPQRLICLSFLREPVARSMDRLVDLGKPRAPSV